MSLYNQSDGDYSSPAHYRPPIRQPAPGVNWWPIITFCLMLVIGGLLIKPYLDKRVTNQPQAGSPTPLAQVTATSELEAKPSPANISNPDVNETASIATAEAIKLDLSTDPTDDFQFYLSQKKLLTATVPKGATNWHINWVINQDLAPILRYLPISPTQIEIWALDEIYDNSSEPRNNGHQAILVELYNDRTGKLAEGRYLCAQVLNPVEVRLPGHARTSPTPLEPNRIVPTVKWEGVTIMSPSDPTPPSDISFEWRWENSEVIGTDPIYIIPGDSCPVGTIYLYVHRGGYTNSATIELNQPESMVDSNGSGNPGPLFYINRGNIMVW